MTAHQKIVTSQSSQIGYICLEKGRNKKNHIKSHFVFHLIFISNCIVKINKYCDCGYFKSSYENEEKYESNYKKRDMPKARDGQSKKTAFFVESEESSKDKSFVEGIIDDLENLFETPFGPPL